MIVYLKQESVVQSNWILCLASYMTLESRFRRGYTNNTRGMYTLTGNHINVIQGLKANDKSIHVVVKEEKYKMHGNHV